MSASTSKADMPCGFDCRNRENDLLERQSYYIIINPEISLLHFTLNCNFNDNWLIAVKVKNSCGH